MKYNNNSNERNATKKKRRGGEGKKPVMHNANAHHPLTDAQLVPEPRSVPPGQLPPVYILGMTFHGMESVSYTHLTLPTILLV